jgi:hypothetical protein
LQQALQQSLQASPQQLAQSVQQSLQHEAQQSAFCVQHVLQPAAAFCLAGALPANRSDAERMQGVRKVMNMETSSETKSIGRHPCGARARRQAQCPRFSVSARTD